MSLPALKTEIHQSATAYDIAQKHLGGIMDKKGFAAYQCFRDFFAEILPEPAKARLFLTDESHYRVTGDFQLFDQAYIDNLTLCLTIKIKSPDVYEEMVKIIDRHVKPLPQNAGLNRLYKECAGFLVALLQHYEGVSVRQTLYAAAQFTKYSESTIEKSYRSRMAALTKKLNNELPPPMALAALYWTLHTKTANPDALEPLKKKSPRSKTEIQKTIAAYWQFTEKVTRHYQGKVLQYLKKRPLNIIPAIAKEYGVNFPLSEEEIQKANAFTVFVVVFAALMIEVMPNELEKLGETL